MGKLFFCFLFVAAASSMQAQSHSITVVSPHIQAPIAVHVPQRKSTAGQIVREYATVSLAFTIHWVITRW